MRQLLLAASALLGASVGSRHRQRRHAEPGRADPAPGSITVTLNALRRGVRHRGRRTTARCRRTTAGSEVATYGMPLCPLVPSFDGVLANRLKYSRSMEVRQNQGFAPANDAVGDLRHDVHPARVRLCRRRQVRRVCRSARRCSLPTELFQVGDPAQLQHRRLGRRPAAGVFRTGLPLFHRRRRRPRQQDRLCLPRFSGSTSACRLSQNGFGDARQPFARVSSASSTSVFDPLAGDVVTVGERLRYGRRRNTVDGAARYQGTFGASA